MPFATACCGIELMATAVSRYDIARFGAEAMRFSPRQCDLMIVAGRVVMKMVPVMQRIWLQMPEPKWCISMGACASSGGVFDTYCTVQGIDRFIPVDVYVPGCPPRPEQLIRAMLDIQEKMQRTGTDRRPRVRRPHELRRADCAGEGTRSGADDRRAGRLPHRDAVSRAAATEACFDHALLPRHSEYEVRRCVHHGRVPRTTPRCRCRPRKRPSVLFAAVEVSEGECGFDFLAELGGIDYLNYPERHRPLLRRLRTDQYRRPANGFS